MKKRKLKAAFTLEAAVVVPITMVIIVSMLFIAFFIHDCVVMNTVSSYMIMENASRYSEQPEIVDEEILQMLSRRMIIAKNISVETTEKEGQLFVKGNSDFYILTPMIQELTNISKATATIHISNLNGRKTLLEYKAICDGFRDVIGMAEETTTEET